MRSKLSSSILLASMLLSAAAIAAVQNAGTLDIKLADGVKRYSAYDPVATKYVVANATDIYADTTQSSKVTGHLDRGQQVVALAKPKDWDWILVGKDGVGIGYVSRGVIAPADQFKS